MMHISNYGDIEVEATTFDDAVHLEIFAAPDEDEKPEHRLARWRRHERKLGYLSINPDQARKLAQQLTAAADKAERSVA